jgi:hypothetical protein
MPYKLYQPEIVEYIENWFADTPKKMWGKRELIKKIRLLKIEWMEKRMEKKVDP